MRGPDCRRWLRIAAVAALTALATAAPAAANDSTAELRMGGLVLKRTDAIEMMREELTIAPEAVTVRYVFRNVPDRDVSETVAFPLPEIDFGATQMVDLAIPDPDAANFVDFRTTIDGEPADQKLEQAAFTNGRNVTAELAKARVPLAGWTDASARTIANLPAKTRRALLRENILSDETGEALPNWVLRTAFVRPQRFPVGRDVVVEHRYRPSIGTSVDTALKSPRDPDALADARRTYCLGADGLRAIDALAREASNAVALPERRIAYVLKTGANWAQPIGEFRLRVETGAPAAAVATCFAGLRPVAPGVFEASRVNFRPDRDLDILIVGR